MKLNLSEAQKEVHDNAVAHGWWDEPKTFGEIIALIHSEVSEALEEYRNKREPDETHYKCTMGSLVCTGNNKCGECEYRKPEGIPSEFADIIIRILDAAEHYDIDLEKAITEKHEYNKTRPYKHGGKVI